MLVGILALAQLHLCTSNYVTASGERCQACLQIQVLEDCGDEVLASHGDCHDCCSIEACEDGNKEVATSASKNTFELAVDLPLLIEDFPCYPISQSATIDPFIASAPSTGPPLKASPRAPPAI